LSTKSLTPIVQPSLLVQDSEYLETHLIVVPTNARKDFLHSYETLVPMVVPRSSIQIAQDEEFTLFAVTTFKKTSAEFLHKCREHKWTPRQYKYIEGGKEEEQRELDRVAKEETSVRGGALRVARAGWSESVMVWAHVMALRVFVETVLRYGLPLEFVCVLVKVCSNLSEQILRVEAVGAFANLTADDAETSQEGKDCLGRDLFVPWRKRNGQGQARARDQGRRVLDLGDGSRGLGCF